MSKKKSKIFAIIIVLIGITIINYPLVATLVNNLFANREISEYQHRVGSMNEEEVEKMIQMALQYNQTLPRDYPADPFSGENIMDLSGTEFEDFSMVQQGTMLGYIEIPDIDIYLPVSYGTSDKVLSEGLGLIENTSLPVGGRGSHSVISGHNGLASRKLFTDLGKLKNGNLFFLHILDKHFAYRINQVKVVLPHQTEDLAIVEQKDYVTLLTCTPFGINDHRLLVRGERVGYDFSMSLEEGSKKLSVWDKYMNLTTWMVVVTFLLIIIIYWKLRKDRLREEKIGEKDE